MRYKMDETTGTDPGVSVMIDGFDIATIRVYDDDSGLIIALCPNIPYAKMVTDALNKQLKADILTELTQ